MGRNTMRRQLERAVQSQREYEDKNAAKMQQAREVREAELRKREDERKKVEEAAAAEKKKVAEERWKMLEVSRSLAEGRAEEERRKEEAEFTTDEEGGKVKRKVAGKKKGAAAGGGGKRKKKGEEGSESEGSVPDVGSGAEDAGEGRAPKRRRKLARGGRGKDGDKFKSSEIVVDSDSEGGEEGGDRPVSATVAATDEDVEMGDGDVEADEGIEEEDAMRRPRKKISRRVEEEDDDDDDDDGQDVGGEEPEPGIVGPGPDAEAGGGEVDEGRGGGGNVFADFEDAAMVDASVGAAGDADATF